MHDRTQTRRGLLQAGVASLGGLMLAACGKIPGGDIVSRLFHAEQAVTFAAQRAILGPNALAPEYGEADISPFFKPNGSTDPQGEAYLKMVADEFSAYRLKVDGLVDRPMAFSLAELRAMPSRTQITRHDCVEGWSCIAKWTGARLGDLLVHVGVKDSARYVVFHCFDVMDAGNSLDGEGTPFYGSIDLVSARHAQTILAYDMNGRTLDVPHGAPLRLRVERQLGYKMSKYIERIELVDSYADFGEGHGGYWEDNGYSWYAGI